MTQNGICPCVLQVLIIAVMVYYKFATNLNGEEPETCVLGIPAPCVALGHP